MIKIAVTAQDAGLEIHLIGGSVEEEIQNYIKGKPDSGKGRIHIH